MFDDVYIVWVFVCFFGVCCMIGQLLCGLIFEMEFLVLKCLQIFVVYCVMDECQCGIGVFSVLFCDVLDIGVLLVDGDCDVVFDVLMCNVCVWVLYECLGFVVLL